MNAVMSIESLDPRKLRGLLAEQQITHVEFARRCHLSRVYISLILNGRARPGELATIKLQRGLAALGLDRQAQVA
jgi:transcriptional regulator with XRE-family HTH domain